jgi:hypothetical protein
VTDQVRRHPVETPQLVGDGGERDVRGMGDVTALPFVELAHVDDVGVLAERS